MIRNARVTTEGHVTRIPELVFVGPDIKEAIVQKVWSISLTFSRILSNSEINVFKDEKRNLFKDI